MCQPRSTATLEDSFAEACIYLSQKSYNQLVELALTLENTTPSWCVMCFLPSPGPVHTRKGGLRRHAWNKLVQSLGCPGSLCFF